MKKTDKKYCLTEENIKVGSYILFRIQALKSFGDVKVGDLGGWVQFERNLDQNGNAWVDNDARVMGNAWVKDNAWVGDQACVARNAWVSDNARVSGRAEIYGNAWISDNAHVGDNAVVGKQVHVCDTAYVGGNTFINDNSCINKDRQVV